MFCELQLAHLQEFLRSGTKDPGGEETDDAALQGVGKYTQISPS